MTQGQNLPRSPEWPDLPWDPPPANKYAKGRPEGPPRLLVVHYTAGSEGVVQAEAGAAYDSVRPDFVSAHYYADADSVVQCVRTTDRAYTAMQSCNQIGIHYELAGTIQTRAQWLDPISRATIRQAARQMARDARKWGIPVRRVQGAQVRTLAGICGHVDCTTGYPEDGGTHTDPGTQFPWDVLLADVLFYYEMGEGEGMTWTPDEVVNQPDGDRLPGLEVPVKGRSARWLWWATYQHVLGTEIAVRTLANAVSGGFNQLATAINAVGSAVARVPSLAEIRGEIDAALDARDQAGGGGG